MGKGHALVGASGRATRSVFLTPDIKTRQSDHKRTDQRESVGVFLKGGDRPECGKDDVEIAERRKSIFTFEHVKARLSARDVPKVVRIVDQKALVTALAGSLNNPDWLASAEHILTNLSQRMTQSLREEMATRGTIKEKDAEEAMSAIIMAIRQLEGSGEIVLVTPED